MAPRHQFARVAAFLLLFAAISAAQENGSALSANGLLTVKGVVTNSVTGEHVRRAMVMLQGRFPRTQLTDDEGRFSFSDVVPGRAMLTAQRPGFQPLRSRRASVDLTSDTEVELRLEPMVNIYGRVISDDDEPLAGVPISIAHAMIREGRRQWVDASRDLTDEDGQFRMASLPPGSYKLSAGPTGSSDVASLETGFAMSFYPDAPDRDSAAALNLSPGQEMEANFKLRRVHSYSITGALPGAGPMARIWLTPHSGEEPLRAPYRYDPDTKSFTIPTVPAGRYKLHAMSFDIGAGEAPMRRELTNQRVATVDVTVSNNVAGLIVNLQPALSIPVNVRSEIAAETSGNVLTPPNPAMPLVQVRLLDLNGGDGEDGRLEQEPGKTSFRLKDVEPGTYEVDVMPNGPWYVASAQCGNRNLLREPLNVTPGFADSIDIVVRNDTGRVNGTLNEKTTATILAFSDAAPDKPIQGTGDDSGHFYLPPLAPGAYTIYAFDDVESLEYANPDVMRRFRSRAARVTISPNQTANVALDVQSTEQ